MFQFPTAKKIKNKALKIAFSVHTKSKLLIETIYPHKKLYIIISCKTVVLQKKKNTGLNAEISMRTLKII